ncbi:membrane protein insertase YidC [Luteolibacter soli]|uniref:Membrane protein insertase YidC n=1 Tax=Luteolibacter soli TaxID=3135280 RepID=A0ABU9ANY1_9BACT
MYDRKTWIAVIACSILLAVNVVYQQKNARLLAEQKQREAAEEAAKKPATPEKPATPDGAPASDKPGSLVEAEPQPQMVEQLVTLETDKTIFTFTSIGGGLKFAEFKEQKPGLEGPVRMNRHGSSPIGAISDGPDRLESVSYEFVEKDSVKDKTVVFRGKLPSGLWAKKTWSLVESDKPGASYVLDFKLQMENGTPNPVNLDQFSLFLGSSSPLDHVEYPTQSGFVWHDDGKFHFTPNSSFAKGWFKPEKTEIRETLEKADFAGVTNQFFATAVKPVEPGKSLVWAKIADVDLVAGQKPVKAIRAGLQLPAVTLAAGEQRGISYQVFTGPKENRMLRKMGDDWGSLMNYGFFSPFSRFMNWSLWWVHAGMEKISGKWSWGLSVIALTLLLRTAIWPLYNRSNRTMKRMAKLKPEMDKLKEKYPDDPQKMNTEMMGLYRKFGINPLGGCLPMFAQLPIFFGFFSMLQHAVEMRGAPFLYWVHDLSQPDTVAHLAGIPINPLPIIMAITSVTQMAMMPNTGGDKTQQTMMKMMPFVFLFMCYNFASALALYWTVSNLFSIGQTWLSNRLPEPELKTKAGGSGKSWVERMAEKQADMERMRQARGRVVDSNDEDPGSSKKRPPRTGG